MDVASLTFRSFYPHEKKSLVPSIQVILVQGRPARRSGNSPALQGESNTGRPAYSLFMLLKYSGFKEVGGLQK